MLSKLFKATSLLMLTGALVSPLMPVTNAQSRSQHSRSAARLPLTEPLVPLPSATPLPAITTLLIRETINGKPLKDVPSMFADDVTMQEWIFGLEELKEIDVLENQTVGNKATLVINMKTAMQPGKIVEDQNGRQYQLVLAGKLRLSYEWVTGEWILMRVENLTMKYSKV